MGHVIATVEVGGANCSASSQPPGYFLDDQKFLVMENPLIPNCISQHERGQATPSITWMSLLSEAGNRRKKNSIRYIRRNEPSVYELRLHSQIILHLFWGRHLNWNQGQLWALPKPVLEKMRTLLRTGSSSTKGEIRCNWFLFWLTDSFHHCSLTFLHTSSVYIFTYNLDTLIFLV